MIQRFKRKSNIVQAIQWNGENFEEITSWVRKYNKSIKKGHAKTIIVESIDGMRILNLGNWIIKTFDDNFALCQKDMFYKLYFPIENYEQMDIIDRIRNNRKKINNLRDEIYK